jgi:sulfide:quinone oxidoreductase
LGRLILALELLAMTPSAADPLNVVVAGGGVAAVELALALHDLAGDRVRLTVIAPQAEFHLRPLGTAVPFAAGAVRHHSLRDLATRVGAELITDSVSAVDPGRRTVHLASGATVPYDALVVAVGARQRPAFTRATTFNDEHSSEPFAGLLADLQEHWSHSVAFVAPAGTTWPLPLYELALMTAAAVRGMGIDDARIQIVSPEATPLALFGAEASRAVADLLDTAGIAFHGNLSAEPGPDGILRLMPGGEPLDSERVVALPLVEGPQIAGLPADERGFVPIDERGRVAGLAGVFAAGDGADYPVKQGGIACQLADAIAEQLAADAGAAVDPQPFRPVLRGQLMTGRFAQYLEQAMADDTAAVAPPRLGLWAAAHKVEGRYLSPWLAELEGEDGPPAPPRGGHVDVAVELPTSYERARQAFRLDPYSPTPPGR